MGTSVSVRFLPRPGDNQADRYAVSTPLTSDPSAPTVVVPMAVPFDLLVRDETTGKIGLKPGTELCGPDMVTFTPRELEAYQKSLAQPDGVRLSMPDTPAAHRLRQAINTMGGGLGAGTALSIALHLLGGLAAVPLAAAAGFGSMMAAKDKAVEALDLRHFVQQVEPTAEQAEQLADLKHQDRMLFAQAGLKGFQGALLLAAAPALAGLIGAAGATLGPVLAAASILLLAGRTVAEKLHPVEPPASLAGLEPAPEVPHPHGEADASLAAAGVSQPIARTVGSAKSVGVAIVPVRVPVDMVVDHLLKPGAMLCDPQVSTAMAAEVAAQTEKIKPQSAPGDAEILPAHSKAGVTTQSLATQAAVWPGGLGSSGIIWHTLSAAGAMPLSAIGATTAFTTARDIGADALNQKARLDAAENQIRQAAADRGQDADALLAQLGLAAKRRENLGQFVVAGGSAARGLLLAGAVTALGVGGMAAAPVAVGLALGALGLGLASTVYGQKQSLQAMWPAIKAAGPMLARALPRLPRALYRLVASRIHPAHNDESVLLDPFNTLAGVPAVDTI